MRASVCLGWAALVAAFTTGVLAGAETAPEFHVALTPENAILGYYSPTKKPVVTVPSGAVVTIDGGGGIRYRDNELSIEAVDAWLKENDLGITVASTPALAETYKVLKETPKLKEATGAHLLVGPVYVEGAEAGDTLEIRILDVRPRIPFGNNSGTPGRGGIPDKVPQPFTRTIRLDMDRNAGIFDGRTEIPLAPFMGVMATCPADAEGPYRGTRAPGVFGGNLDCKELVAGATLYLPVFQKGGLFYTGDSHAGQGDGEVTGNAIETANTVKLQFIVRKDLKLAGPRAETPTHYMSFGLDPDLNKAMSLAILDTIDFLKTQKGYTFFEAYSLSSIAVDFRVTQFVDLTLGVHGMIPKRIFVTDANPYWYRPR